MKKIIEWFKGLSNDKKLIIALGILLVFTIIVGGIK